MPPTLPKKVLCIMDLSCVGRAGLAAALPALCACGVQACGLPASLFSSHTGGFGAVEKLDAAAFGEAALAHWAREGVSFDAVATGYLYGADQFALARRALAQYPNALHLVDPALGDDGKPYGGLGPDTVDAMRALVGAADLITPNHTESALLLGEEPDMAPPGEAAIAARLERLARLGRGGADAPASALPAHRRVLITSVPAQDGGFATWGRDAEGAVFTIPSRHLPRRYPGAGDLLCAATLGLMLSHGWPLHRAARQATDFVETAVAATYAAGTPAREGLLFEPLLGMLAGLENDDGC